jgi:hypothetical protein
VVPSAVKHPVESLPICGERDADHDQILDPCDACPNEPENYNGIEDEDGCPETRLVLPYESIGPLPAIDFGATGAQPSPAGMKALDTVAMTLLEDPAIDRAAVLGQEARGLAVMDLLVKKGVDRERLEAHAVGEGRLVDARVLRRSGWDWFRWNGTDVVPGDAAPVGSRPTSPRVCEQPFPPCRPK